MNYANRETLRNAQTIKNKNKNLFVNRIKTSAKLVVNFVEKVLQDRTLADCRKWGTFNTAHISWLTQNWA